MGKDSPRIRYNLRGIGLAKDRNSISWDRPRIGKDSPRIRYDLRGTGLAKDDIQEKLNWGQA